MILTRHLQMQYCTKIVLYYIIITVALISYVCLQFLEAGPELGSHYNEVIAPQDVATYGGLCALATFDRTELKVPIQLLLLSLFFTMACF